MYVSFKAIFVLNKGFDCIIKRHSMITAAFWSIYLKE